MTRLVEPGSPGITRTTPPKLSAPATTTRSTFLSPVAASTCETGTTFPNASWPATRNTTGTWVVSAIRPSTSASPQQQQKARRSTGLSVERGLALHGPDRGPDEREACLRSQGQVHPHTARGIGYGAGNAQQPVGDAESYSLAHHGGPCRVTDLKDHRDRGTTPDCAALPPAQHEPSERRGEWQPGHVARLGADGGGRRHGDHPLYAIGPRAPNRWRARTHCGRPRRSTHRRAAARALIDLPQHHRVRAERHEIGAVPARRREAETGAAHQCGKLAGPECSHREQPEQIALAKRLGACTLRLRRAAAAEQQQ